MKKILKLFLSSDDKKSLFFIEIIKQLTPNLIRDVEPLPAIWIQNVEPLPPIWIQNVEPLPLL